MDIVEFLTARLDEDETAAKFATAGTWSYDPSKQWQDPGHSQLQGQECVTYGTPPPANSPAAFGPPLPSGGCIATTGPADDPQSMMDAAHIARHGPDRVLREVAAKRAIINAYRGERALATRDGANAEWEARMWLLESVLYNLAAVHADHPDYGKVERP